MSDRAKESVSPLEMAVNELMKPTATMEQLKAALQTLSEVKFMIPVTKEGRDEERDPAEILEDINKIEQLFELSQYEDMKTFLLMLTTMADIRYKVYHSLSSRANIKDVAFPLDFMKGYQKFLSKL